MLLILILVFTILRNGFVSANAQDPVTYFNGTDHDAYLKWLQASPYERSAFLPSPAGPSAGAALHWNITNDSIYLAVAARALGWVAFGIAKSGGMKGADTVIFMAADNTLIDSHILEERFPLPDECQSWTLVNAQTDGGFLIFEAVRLLDTGDPQDHPIIQDGDPGLAPSRVIAAWSDYDNLQYHGPNGRAQSSLRFYADSDDAFQDVMAAEAEGSIELTAKDYPIKAMDTEYAHFCFNYADLVNAGMPNNTQSHTIGVEPIIDSVKHVHHFVLYGSQDDIGEADCEDFLFMEIAYLWAPGEGPFLAPTNVGGPLGENGFKSFKLEIHYNNPWLDEGVLDSSGIRLYFTSQLRPQEFGILPIGDPFVSLVNQSVGDNFAQHTFDCPSSCSSVALNESVTVFKESLHMHRTGQSMLNYQIRNGDIVRMSQVQFYDFEQQGAYAVQGEPFQIEPGDSFRTVCQYKSNDTVFGFSSQEEMCIAFLAYYPRKTFSSVGFEVPYTCGYDIFVSVCNSTWEYVELQGESDLNRTFGNAADDCATDALGGTGASGAVLISSWISSILTLALPVLLD